MCTNNGTLDFDFKEQLNKNFPHRGSPFIVIYQSKANPPQDEKIRTGDFQSKHLLFVTLVIISYRTPVVCCLVRYECIFNNPTEKTTNLDTSCLIAGI